MTPEERAKDISLYYQNTKDRIREVALEHLQEVVQQAQAELEPWLRHKNDCRIYILGAEFPGSNINAECTCGLEKIKEMGG